MSTGAAQHSASFANKWDLEEKTPEMLAREMLHREGAKLIARPPAPTKGRLRRGTTEFDLSFLLAYPSRTMEALSIALTLRLATNKHGDGRYQEYRTISTDFHAFLQRRAPDLTLAKLDDDLLAGFQKSLTESGSPHRDKAPTTLREKVYAVQRMLKHLKLSKEFQQELSPHLKNLRKPFQGATEHTNHNETIKDGDFEDAYSAAAEECRDAMDEFETAVATITRLRTRGVPLEQAGRSATHCAAHLLGRFPDRVVPSWSKLAKADAGYRRHVPRTVHEAADRLLYPKLREFAAPLIVLASAFALNPGTLIAMRTDDFIFERLGGVERMRIKPRKGRANWKRQRHAVTITDHHDNPGRVIRFVEMRTQFLREAAGLSGRFLFLRLNPGNRSVVTPILNGAWLRAIDALSAEHGVERFTLEQIRPTMLEKVHELTGGDVSAVRALGKQRSNTTLERSYRTPGTVRTGEDRLYAAMALRHRDIATNGLVSNIERPKKKIDRWAATPGYTCLDTFDSPIHGQEKGRPCTAYGQCPRCELAMTDHGSAIDFAYLNHLRRRIDETAETIGPQAWLEKWAPVQTEVLIDIALFTGDPEAAMRDAVVHPLPPLE